MSLSLGGYLSPSRPSHVVCVSSARVRLLSSIVHGSRACVIHLVGSHLRLFHSFAHAQSLISNAIWIIVVSCPAVAPCLAVRSLISLSPRTFLLLLLPATCCCLNCLLPPLALLAASCLVAARFDLPLHLLLPFHVLWNARRESQLLGRGKQGDAIRADIMSPQVDDRGPRLMSSPHKRHRERVPNLIKQSKKGVGHDTVLRPWSAMGASSTNRATRRRLGHQCQAQGPVASMVTVRTVSD